MQGKTLSCHFPAAKLTQSNLRCLIWKDEEGCEQKFHLRNEVSMKWKDIGFQLHLTNNQLEVWFGKYNRDADECWIRVMDHWLTGEGPSNYPVTWDGLYNLLKDVNLSQIAKDLKDAVNKSRILSI